MRVLTEQEIKVMRSWSSTPTNPDRENWSLEERINNYWMEKVEEARSWCIKAPMPGDC